MYKSKTAERNLPIKNKNHICNFLRLCFSKNKKYDTKKHKTFSKI